MNLTTSYSEIVTVHWFISLSITPFNNINDKVSKTTAIAHSLSYQANTQAVYLGYLS